MRIRFSIRLLLLVTGVAGIALMLVRLRSEHLSLGKIFAELKLANAEAYVNEYSDDPWPSLSPLQIWHIETEGVCSGLRINKVSDYRTLRAASEVKTTEQLTILKLGKNTTVRKCDFRHLRDLHIGNVNNEQVCDWVLAAPNLDHLSIAAIEDLTPETFACIGKIRWLNTLRLSDTSVSKEHLASLGSLPAIRFLSLESCELGPDVFDQLNDFPILNSIQLYGPHYDNLALNALRHLTQITSLNLTLTSIDDQGIKSLQGWTHLRELDLYGCSRITSACVPNLVQMPFLNYLNVLRTAVEFDEGLHRVFQHKLQEWSM
ncbi:MAG: hypothetical protein WBD20_21270 [Pirellulaceae bacterium]